MRSVSIINKESLRYKFPGEFRYKSSLTFFFVVKFATTSFKNARVSFLFVDFAIIKVGL